MEQTNRSKVFIAGASKRSEGVKKLREEFDVATDGTIQFADIQVGLTSNINSRFDI
jgi:hypothetical protein